MNQWTYFISSSKLPIVVKNPTNVPKLKKDRGGNTYPFSLFSSFSTNTRLKSFKDGLVPKFRLVNRNTSVGPNSAHILKSLAPIVFLT